MVADASEDLETRICQLQMDLSAVKTVSNPWATPFSIITGEHLRVYPDNEKRVMAEAELLGISYKNPRYWDEAREAIKQGKAEQLKKDEQLEY